MKEQTGVTIGADANPCHTLNPNPRSIQDPRQLCGLVPKLKGGYQLPRRENQSQVMGLGYVDATLCSVRADNKSQGQHNFPERIIFP